MPDTPLPDLDKPALLAALRARVARLERPVPAGTEGRSVPLCSAIDQYLPNGGLARAGVHEVLAADPGAATGFCALVLARSGGTVIWIGAEPEAWPPGLARFGLSPAELVLVHAPRPADGLWAMEESLRCPGVAGALLVLPELDLTAARRLQLAAEAGGAIGLLLHADATAAAGGPIDPPLPASRAGRQTASVALTRWRVSALAGTGRGSHDLGDPRWHLELLRCRGGQPHDWQVVWRPAAERLDLDHDGEADAGHAAPRGRPAR
jgi:protein ImuA